MLTNQTMRVSKAEIIFIVGSEHPHSHARTHATPRPLRARPTDDKRFSIRHLDQCCINHSLPMHLNILITRVMISIPPRHDNTTNPLDKI